MNASDIVGLAVCVAAVGMAFGFQIWLAGWATLGIAKLAGRKIFGP